MSIHPVELFCSYADADEPLYLELEKHLSLLHREGVISSRHKRQVLAGTDWTKALDEHLSTASVILLLISADFVASDYCYGTEMQRAMERYEAGEAYVIPILLRPVDWQNAPFGKLQALPSSGKPITRWRNRDAAFADVAQGIREVLRDTPPLVASTPSSPFRHSSLSPDSPDPPLPMPPRENNEFNSIYLLKIIEEHGVTTLEEEEESVQWQTCDGTRKITAWLAAKGDVTYVIDSLTIGHRNRRGDIPHSGRSGAVLPDAQYCFPLLADSTKTYALNPALVLSHEDRREVSFSLKLIPPKKGESPEFDSGGPVEVVLHYHTSNGTQGKLYLAPSPEDGVALSQLLKADVEMNGLLICPKGCQRGNDEKSESGQVRERFSYEPFILPHLQLVHYICDKNDFNGFEQDEFFYHLCSENASLLFSLTPERQILNKAIEEKGILPHIQNLLLKVKDAREPRRHLLFELCAGHPHVSCEQALIQVGMSEIAIASQRISQVGKSGIGFAGTVVAGRIGSQTNPQKQKKRQKNGNWFVNPIISWVIAPLHAALLGKKRLGDKNQTRLEQPQVHTSPGDILDSVVGALAIRHMLQPSETLADFLLRLPHTRLLESATHAALVALVVHRKGKWLQALTILPEVSSPLFNRDVLQALLLIREKLTNEERHMADEFAREQSEPFLKLDTVDFQQIYHTSIGSAIKYLLQIDSSSREIRQKLLEWESALPRLREYSQLQKKEFKRWITSLLD